MVRRHHVGTNTRGTQSKIMVNFSDNAQTTLQHPHALGNAGHETARLFHDFERVAPRTEVQHSPLYLGVRRASDIAVSLLALTLFTALLPIIALAIVVDSRGPVFYSQTRIGRNLRRRNVGYSSCERRKVIYPGRPFRIWKLRSMRTDAERNGPQLAQAGDARITRVGRFLRQTRLDEVPQFWNVLKGDMTLIGPRPERLCFVRQYEAAVPGYLARLDALPGITGLAQVNNGYDDDLRSVQRKLRLDTFYITRAGWMLDLRILLSTVRVVLTGEGAR
jgi:lipopolysaccharide/colanic/teichoic acid biosynthesis glycosyltransferase